MALTRIANASAIAACNAVVDRLDLSTPTPGYVEIRSGSQPSDPDAAATGTLIVTITLQDPAFAAAADINPGARAAVNGTPNAAAVAGAVAGWFRAYTGGNAKVIQGNCGGTGSGEDMELDNTTVALGQTVTIVTWTVTQPES